MERFWSLLERGPNVICFAFVYAFWMLLWGLVSIGKWMNGKSLGDGPSLMPQVLVFPVVFSALAAAINLVVAPYGTIAVIVVHLGYFPVILLQDRWKKRRA